MIEGVADGYKPGSVSTNAECGLDLEEECEDCILTLKLSLEPDVCEDVDSTVSVFESGSKTLGFKPRAAVLRNSVVEHHVLRSPVYRPERTQTDR